MKRPPSRSLLNHSKLIRFKRTVGIFIQLFLMVLLIGLSSCKEKVEGCMDVTAANWNASADKSCDDCCTFPSLIVRIDHMYGDTSLLYDSLYTDAADKPFFIAGIRYYLSGFNLDDGIESLGVNDSLDVELITLSGNEEETLEDNFALVSRSITSKTIGTFENSDITTDSLFFVFGLNQAANQVDPASVSSPHPLAIDSDTMYVNEDEHYIFAKLSIVPDTMSMDTVVYTITGNNNLREIRLLWERDLERGVNITVPLVADYQKWFAGINFVTDSDDSIKEQIVNNLTEAFTIQE